MRLIEALTDVVKFHRWVEERFDIRLSAEASKEYFELFKLLLPGLQRCGIKCHEHESSAACLIKYRVIHYPTCYRPPQERPTPPLYRPSYQGVPDNVSVLPRLGMTALVADSNEMGPWMEIAVRQMEDRGLLTFST